MVANAGGGALFLFLLFYLAVIAVLVVAWGRILGKAGYNPWLCLLALIPFVNLVMFLVFAFSTWPNQRQPGVGYGPPPGSSSWGQSPPPGGSPPVAPGNYPSAVGTYPPPQQPPPPASGMA